MLQEEAHVVLRHPDLTGVAAPQQRLDWQRGLLDILKRAHFSERSSEHGVRLLLAEHQVLQVSSYRPRPALQMDLPLLPLSRLLHLHLSPSKTNTTLQHQYQLLITNIIP